jgi:short-subunit dehydrogenase
MLSTSRPAVVVTGGSSGLGAACARAFARAGCDVAIAARQHDRLASVAADLASEGGRVLAVSADVTDGAAMRTLASRVLAAFGRLDILVCSAGVGYQGTLDETSAGIMQRVLEVNVTGTLNAARAVIPYFEAQRAGHLIVISSIVGKRGIPGYAAYSAAKFAQAGLAEVLRAELRETGIAVTTVFPVSVDTGFRDAMAREFGVRSEGIGPRQSPDDVASAVMRAVRSRAAEVYPLRRARLLAWVSALTPGLADRLVRRFARRRRHPDGQPDRPGSESHEREP